MAGRTVEKYLRFVIADSSDTLREIPIDAPPEVGVAYESKDVHALQDAVKNYLSGHGDAPIKITGPVDTTAATTVAGSGATPTLSGSHTVLTGINGDNKPHTCYVAIGIARLWTTGDPVFGLQRATATNSGYTVTDYKVTGEKYTANLVVMGGVSPAWGTAALTNGS